MPVFQTKITHARLHLSPFSAEQMAQIGERMVYTITSRIESAVDARDLPAHPLTEKYAKRKVRYFGGVAIRNWTWRGVTLKSIKVKSANENQVRIGFIAPQAIAIVNGIARYGQMWGTSPKDEQVLHRIVAESLRTQHHVRMEKRKTA